MGVWTKQISNGQLYVWHNGRLVYKRWLDRGYGVVFDPYGPPFSCKESDHEFLTRRVLPDWWKHT